MMLIQVQEHLDLSEEHMNTLKKLNVEEKLGTKLKPGNVIEFKLWIYDDMYTDPVQGTVLSRQKLKLSDRYRIKILWNNGSMYTTLLEPKDLVRVLA